MAFLSNQPLDLGVLTRAVTTPERGAVATFLGLVRNHHGGRAVTSLVYSAYGEMAENLCSEIRSEAERKWNVKVDLRHRLGELTVGDAAVAVAVGGTHRDEAFLACRWVIDELKRRVPIWKLERYGDGSEAWVDPTAPEGTRLRPTP